MKRFDKCPKCGGTSGLYTKSWVRYTQFHTWDGGNDGGDYSASRGGGMMYCRDCDEPICRTSTFIGDGDAR